MDCIGGIDEPLDPYAQCEQNRCDGHRRHPHLLPLVHLRFGSPVKEFHNVFGHLGCRRGRAVFVLDETIVENASHCDTYAIHQHRHTQDNAGMSPPVPGK